MAHVESEIAETDSLLMTPRSGSSGVSRPSDPMKDERMEAAAQALAEGVRRREAAKRAGVPTAELDRWIVAGELTTRMTWLVQERARFEAPRALRAVVALAHGAESERVRLAAAAEILNRVKDLSGPAGGAAVQVVIDLRDDRP